MKLSRVSIAHTIADKALKSGVTPQLSQEVAAYLLTEGRVNELSSVMRDVQAELEQEGYVEVVARSAHDLDQSNRESITSRVKSIFPNAKQIIITEIHDPNVIGGVRLSLANQQLDLSVEAKLNKFKQLTTAGKD